MRVLEGGEMAAGLLDALNRLQNVDEIAKAGKLEIGAAEHQGVTFHRLTFAGQAPEAVAVFGNQVGLTVGIGSQAVWGVLGGEESLSTLTDVMDRLEEALQSPQDRATPPNFRVIVNVNQLVEMATIADTAGKSAREQKEKAAAAEKAAKNSLEKSAEAAPQPAAESSGRGRNRNRQAEFARRQEIGGKIFRDTLAEGDDRIEVDSRLTETGVRMRVRLEEGFVKIFGRLIASRFETQEPTESQPTPDATPVDKQ